MSKTKKLFLTILLIASILCLTACQESNEAKYNRAGKLLTEGKYEEAVKLFDEISTYEDASKMAMYGKAIAAAENGDYKSAFSSFQALGDYKDCSMMITYYSARQYESEATDTNWSPQIMAAETYDTIALFLDSKDRSENCLKAVYDKAVSYAGMGQYVESIEMFSALRDYKDSETLRRYYEAFSFEQENKFTEASSSFAALGDYKDSNNQATAVLERGYQKADVLEKNGDQEAAYKLFVNLGEYKDSFVRANKPYYDLGIEKRKAAEWNEAVAAFEHAGIYEDAVEQIKATRYAEGEAKCAAQDWDGAVTAFVNAGNYSDAQEKILATRYAEGEAKRAAQDWDGALTAFENAGNYSDAKEQISATYYAEGIEERNNHNWEAAVKTFEKAGNYSDAKAQIRETVYAEGDAKREAKDYNGAIKAYEEVGEYKDAFSKLLATKVDLGIQKRENKQWQEAISIFEDVYPYNSEVQIQITETKYQQATSLLEEGNYSSALGVFQSISGYKDVDSLLQTDEHLQAEVERLRKEKRDAFRMVGNVVTFGRYEQDNNVNNGPEEIEWVVLNVQDGKSLLISKYALDSKPFNDEYVETSWNNCSLRKWLNGEFYNEAFDAEEKAAIQNEITILSYDEAFNIYLNGVQERRCEPTNYAISHGAYKDDRGVTEWWLRSMVGGKDAEIVLSSGLGNYRSVDYEGYSVRPVIWLIPDAV